MIGLVLAAGAGRRLHPLTDDLPKTLLPVRESTSVLELILGNLAAVGISDVAVVTGFAEHRIAAVQAELAQRHGVTIELVHNDRALEWNNAYSLWCARDHFAGGALLCNGDTVHPVDVEKTVLTSRTGNLLLAVDAEKSLADEEMKVRLDDAGRLRQITKLMPPADADGEYIGVSLIEPAVAAELVSALAATWGRDPDLYYEDGFQELVRRGVPVDVAPIGVTEWVEIDNHDDLARAREIACRY